MTRKNDATTVAVPKATILAAGESAESDLAALTTEELRGELGRVLELTASTLRRLAAIVRILEDRGEDLSDLKLGFLGYVRRVAHGQLLPEVVVRFGASPMLLQRAAALPLPDQRRLASGEPVPLVVWGDDGRPDVRLADPGKMGREQLVQVFGPQGIRDEAEQILMIEAKGRPKAAGRGASGRRAGGVKVDRKRGGIVVGKSFVPTASVIEALASLGEDEGGGGEFGGETYSSPCMVTLTVSQHAALKRAAIEGRTSVANLVRRALTAYGLLSGM